MKIYTKTGDQGKTSLFGGRRLLKDALRIDAYGTVDELNSALGVARAWKPTPEIDEILGHIQNDLFVVVADLATPPGKRGNGVLRVRQKHVTDLEGIIDKLTVRLKPLSNFIVPGGSHVAAQLHLARTVCRRAERLVVKLSRKSRADSPCIRYPNRLADLLFVLARCANQLDGIDDIPWTSRSVT